MSGYGLMAVESNVLLIMADEFARHVMGCAGHPLVQTPHLDRLAHRGVRFTQAYTNSPICVPARAALHTGRYVHDIRCWNSAQPYRGGQESWAHRLRRHGMDTVSAGKLHFRRTQDDNGFAPELQPMHVKDGIGWAPGLLRNPPGDYPAAADLAAQVGALETEYHAYDRSVAAAATGWLERRTGADGRPWALFVSFVSPHYPLAAPPRWFDLYRNADLPSPKPYAGNWREHPALRETLRFFDYDRYFDDASRDAAIRGYLGLVSFVDDLIGQVLAALDSAGFADNTTIIFTSDHGEMLGDFGLWTKQVMFEGSAGIPMILAGTGDRGGPDGRDAGLAGRRLSHRPGRHRRAACIPAPARPVLAGDRRRARRARAARPLRISRRRFDNRRLHAAPRRLEAGPSRGLRAPAFRPVRRPGRTARPGARAGVCRGHAGSRCRPTCAGLSIRPPPTPGLSPTSARGWMNSAAPMRSARCRATTSAIPRRVSQAATA